MGVGEAHVKNNPQGSGRMHKRLAPPDGETGRAVLANRLTPPGPGLEMSLVGTRMSMGTTN